MRILIFLPFLTLGGAERQGFLVAQYLKGRGHHVEVWGFKAPEGLETLVHKLGEQGIGHHELSSWPHLEWQVSSTRLPLWPRRRLHWLKQRRALAASMPARRFDVIVPFTFTPSLIASLIRDRLGAKRAFWNHRGGYDDEGVRYSSFLKERVSAYRPRFLANSRVGAKFLRDTFNLSADQVTTIPNVFLPDSEYSKPAIASPNSPSSKLTLIQVANFFVQKDYDTLLRGLRVLKTRGIACQLHFCGGFPDPSEQSKFLDRVQNLGVQDQVIFHGATKRKDVLRLLSESDIGLLSSKSEGQPNCVMEYMHTGLPVIATMIPGIAELVGSENEEWLFEVGDAEGFAKRVERLARDPALRASIGQHNRRRLDEQFAPEQILPRWAELIEGQ